jgi:hypothetical protein
MSFELPWLYGMVSCLFHLPSGLAQAAHIAEREAETHVSDLGMAILAGAVVAFVATVAQVVRHWRHDDGRRATEGSL